MMEHVYEETSLGTAIRERVTRCRDCESAHGDGDQLWCEAPLGSFGYTKVRPSDFCSAGWPKEEGK